jgi:methyl-accepting chemotaxis protein
VNFLPQALAWLEESAKSWTHSSQQVYAKAILNELKRLNDAMDTHATEFDKRETLRKKERAEFVTLTESFNRLKEEMARGREAWDAERVKLEGRLSGSQEKLTNAENLLRDIHHGLLKQPELTREELAAVITSLVTPYPEGAKA